MKIIRLSTQIHKWVALVVGLQLLFWVGGGLVMVAIPIETVRSEHHYRKPVPAVLPLDEVLPVAEVARRAGVTPVKVELRSTRRGAVWVLTPGEGEPTLVGAVTGHPLPRMTADEAMRLATQAYVGTGSPVQVGFFNKAPQESGQDGTVWAVTFDDLEKTTFYLSPDTGEVLSRRSAVWRFYDFMWRLHILDLENGENFNHPLLIGVTALAFSVVITGFILLWVRLAEDWRRARRGRRNGRMDERVGEDRSSG